jgi:hypothetical protein
MFQTITKLFEKEKGKYIYFGASIIYCDEKNVCFVYYPDTSVIPAATASDIKTVVATA